jgi:hypothetical protein
MRLISAYAAGSALVNDVIEGKVRAAAPGAATVNRGH